MTNPSRYHYLMFTLAVVAVLGACSRQTKRPDDPDPLVGVWDALSIGGKQSSTAGVTITWTFHDGKITVTDTKAGRVISRSPYRLDLRAKPPHIDMEIEDVEVETRRGIYAIEGDRLRIRFSVGGGPRPADFSASSDLVFQRAPVEKCAGAKPWAEFGQERGD
jgi:uncharacterized protein (TIGR03067 family)